MNIFKILSSYDGSIKEPNISSFLAYLLDLNEDHGLSDLLLKSIVLDFQEINKDFFSKISKFDLNQYDIRINPEYSVFLENKRRRDIDIVIEFYDVDKTEPIYTLCIENKITDSSIQKNTNQLKDELEGLQKEYAENKWKTEIYFCFLTLEKSEKAEAEYNSFKYEKKIHLFWKGEKSIQKKILDILEKDRFGDIDPITEDSKFLIKSFLAFIKTDFKSTTEEKNDKIERKSYGKTVLEFFREFYDKMEDDKDYKVVDIKNTIAENIKKLSGINPNKGTLNCHFYATTVNESNRIHYNVTEKNSDKKNLFYYPYSDNKEIVKKFNDDAKGVVKIYVKEYGEQKI